MELQEVERSENNVDKDSYFVKDESVDYAENIENLIKETNRQDKI